jgi:RES domain
VAARERVGSTGQGPGGFAQRAHGDVIGFRQCPSIYPFLWEGTGQPEGRWNRHGEGPVHYFADTPDGAWAEFLRQEEIRDPDDLAGIARTIWAIELGSLPAAVPRLRPAVLTGDRSTYSRCQREAQALRSAGASGLVTPSAALLGGGAPSLRVDGGLQDGTARDGQVIVLFGPRPDLSGWRAAIGRPDASLLARVRHFELAGGKSSTRRLLPTSSKASSDPAGQYCRD